MTREQYRQAILDFPDQFTPGLESGHLVKLTGGPFDNVLVCGMGGSALGAELLRAWQDLGASFGIHGDYDLPKVLPVRTLIIAVSYSGNTEETLSAAQAALAQKRPLVAITTGGRLAELAKKNKFPVALLTPGLPPRLSVGLQLGALYSVLVNAGLIKADEEAIIEAAAEVAQIKDIEHRGQKIASEIGQLLPLIYGSSRNFAVLRNWKIKLNETAKIQAFWQALPEANHNALNALTDRGERFCLVALSDRADSARVKLRLDLTAKIAAKQEIKVVGASLEGSSRLSRLLYGVWLGDWVALALADQNKTDPVGTPLIDQLKSELAKS